MEKIIVLGTGTGGAIESFNTCFVLEDNNKEYFIVDFNGEKLDVTEKHIRL